MTMDWGELCDIIARNRDFADRMAALAPEVLDAGDRAGLWVLCAPKEHGGLELPVAEQLALYELLGQADPTVAWHALNSGALGLGSAWLPPEVRDEAFAAPTRPAGLTFSPTGATLRRDGSEYVIDGAWPFMTGVANARWCVLAAELVGPSGVEGVRRVMVAVDALDRQDNWQGATAMRGTGSHAVRVRDLRVDADRIINPALPPLIDRTLYRWPVSMVSFGAAAALCLGIVRAAIAGAGLLVEGKTSSIDRHAYGEEPRVLDGVGDAYAMVDSRSQGLQAFAAQLDAHFEIGARPPVEMRARWWSLVLRSFDDCTHHVSRLATISTSALYATTNPVERALRDAHAVSAAMESFRPLARDAARVLLGREPTHPML